MTTDDKIAAVGEFFRWREDNEPTATLSPALLERWRDAMEAARAADTLARWREEAALAHGDTAAALQLVGRIAGEL